MRSIWQWLFGEPGNYDWRSVVRIAKRVVTLFIVFNLVYYLLQPLQIGRPTLYNSVFPGRLRMEWTPGGYESLGINELRLSRLLADHVISRPKGRNEYRIVFIGSSEIWGYSNHPQDAMPAVLDKMGLSGPRGKEARVYNLSYVYPNAVKDMLILYYTLSQGSYDPDMVIWAVNPWTVDPLAAEPHWLETANPELTIEMAERYGLSSPALDQVEAELEIPWWRRHSFLYERNDVSYWLLNQYYGLAWTSVGTDLQLPDETREISKQWVLGQPGVFEAFVTMTQDYGIPLYLVSPPIGWEPLEYRDWINSRAEELNIALLDCSDLLPERYYTNEVTHFNAEGHRLFAEQVVVWYETLQTAPPPKTDRVTKCLLHN